MAEDNPVLKRGVLKRGFNSRVGNAGLDGSVANHLELDIERRVALGKVDRDSAGHGGKERDTGGELHLERVLRGCFDW